MCDWIEDDFEEYETKLEPTMEIPIVVASQRKKSKS